MPDNLMTPLELAAYVRVDRRTVYRYLREEDLPGIRMVGRWRFRKDDVDRWLLQGTGLNGQQPQGATEQAAQSSAAALRSLLIATVVAALTLWTHTPATAIDTTPIEAKPGEAVYVFISSSMPEAALLTIASDAAPVRTPVILRGLVGESLQETLARMQALVRVGAALEIDPLLFEAYNIEQAPAVVLSCGARGEGPFAVVYGIGPSQALPILRRMLQCS